MKLINQQTKWKILNMKKTNTTGILIVALLITFNSYAQFGGPSVVKVEKVKKIMMAPVRKIPAMVEAKFVATINTEYKGTIINIADVGAMVKKGEVLAELSDSQSQLKLDELTSAVRSAQAQFDFLESENVRLKSLIGKNLVSNSELEKNKSDFISAKNTKQQAKSRLKQYEDQINKLNIKAPFDGIVLNQLAQPGQLVNNGNAIIEFMQTNNLEVKVNVPIKYKTQIKIGETWKIETQDTTIINAKISSFVRAARGNSRTVEVRLSVTSLNLWSGEAVNVLVPTQARKQVMAVPRDALVIRKDGVFIYTVVDNKSNKVDVKTGMAEGDLIQITGLVSEGDQVIIRGNERLRDKQDVKIIE